jgi:pathogenesis-related protein 1
LFNKLRYISFTGEIMKYILVLISLIFIGCGAGNSLANASKVDVVDKNFSDLVLLDIDSRALNTAQSSEVNLSVIGTFSDDSVADVTDDVTWNSSDESIATVDENGTVNAIKSGTVTISVEKNDVVDTETITIAVPTVKEEIVPVTEEVVEKIAKPVIIPDNIKDLLDIHNKARIEIGVDNNLTWNDTIATDAQSYADEMSKSGAWEHDSKNHNGYKNGVYGENLYIGTLKPTFTIATQAWIDEKEFYHYGVIGDDGTCDEGEICGHYTQVIWKDTTEVGCAMSQYVTGQYKDWYIVVCKYQTPGNYLNETPY